MGMLAAFVGGAAEGYGDVMDDRLKQERELAIKKAVQEFQVADRQYKEGEFNRQEGVKHKNLLERDEAKHGYDMELEGAKSKESKPTLQKIKTMIDGVETEKLLERRPDGTWIEVTPESPVTSSGAPGSEQLLTVAKKFKADNPNATADDFSRILKERGVDPGEVDLSSVFSQTPAPKKEGAGFLQNIFGGDDSEEEAVPEATAEATPAASSGYTQVQNILNEDYTNTMFGSHQAAGQKRQDSAKEKVSRVMDNWERLSADMSASEKADSVTQLRALAEKAFVGNDEEKQKVLAELATLGGM